MARGEILKLRVSAEEKAALVERAAAAGVSASEFVRWLVFAEPVTVRVDRAAVVEAAVDGLRAGFAQVEEDHPELVGRVPTAEQLAGRNRVPVAIARRWLASGEWRAHWGSAS